MSEPRCQAMIDGERCGDPAKAFVHDRRLPETHAFVSPEPEVGMRQLCAYMFANGERCNHLESHCRHPRVRALPVSDTNHAFVSPEPEVGTCQSSASSGFGHSGGIPHEERGDCRDWRAEPAAPEAKPEPPPHQHEWREADQYGTLRCNVCGKYETELASYGAAPEAKPELMCAICGEDKHYWSHVWYGTGSPYHSFVAPEAKPEPPQHTRYFLASTGRLMGHWVCECGADLGDEPIDEIDAIFTEHQRQAEPASQPGEFMSALDFMDIYWPHANLIIQIREKIAELVEAYHRAALERRSK